jgi:hypothetical protein
MSMRQIYVRQLQQDIIFNFNIQQDQTPATQHAGVPHLEKKLQGPSINRLLLEHSASRAFQTLATVATWGSRRPAA